MSGAVTAVTLGLSLVAIAGERVAPPPSTALIQSTSSSEYFDEILEGGVHWRVGTAEFGPVHLWRPLKAPGPRAPVVVYLHGYYINVDGAFVEHSLARQFADSNVAAYFIVPECPSARGEAVTWKSVEALLSLASRVFDVRLEHRPLTLIGHSGAYRTMLAWLSAPRLSRIILLDGLYAGEEELADWLAGSSDGGRRLIAVGNETIVRLQSLVAHRRGGIYLDSLPHLFTPPSHLERVASVVGYYADTADHMSIVTAGRVIPMLLHSVHSAK